MDRIRRWSYGLIRGLVEAEDEEQEMHLHLVGHVRSDVTVEGEEGEVGRVL